MKKYFYIIFCLLLLSVSQICADETSDKNSGIKSEDIKYLYLRTGMSFITLTVNNYTYYRTYETDYPATIVEIAYCSQDMYKIVYAEPLNKAGARQYITVYLKKGDMIGSVLSFKIILAGQVSSYETNCIKLIGIVK